MIAMIAVVVMVALGLLMAAWRLAWLTFPGTLMAAGVGGAVFAGTGVGGLGLLLLFFVTSSILTARNPARAEGYRTARNRRPDVPESRSGEGLLAGFQSDRDAAGRGARQVLANGGVAAACALLGLAGWLQHAHYAVAGALAAATADTWATEGGTARAGRTRLITTWKHVSPGRSGGVSVAGTAAGVAGALLIGAAAGLLFPAGGPDLGLPTHGSSAGWGVSAGVSGGGLVATLTGGVAGMTVDSLLGATLEGRVNRIDNDAVNLVGTMAGASVAWWLGALLAGA